MAKNRLLNIPMGVYLAGDSVIHRMSAGRKILALIFLIIINTIFRSLPFSAVLCGFTVVLYLIAKVPVQIALRQLIPPLPFILFLAVIQAITTGIMAGVTTIVMLYAALSLAILMTLTTKVSDLLLAFDHALTPLERFGVPAKDISLAISLTIRLLPLQLATVYTVMDARKARGAATSLMAFGTPVVVRSLRRAQAIGDALLARGVGDD